MAWRSREHEGCKKCPVTDHTRSCNKKDCLYFILVKNNTAIKTSGTKYAALSILKAIKYTIRL